MKQTFTCFSGDMLGPSIISSVEEGLQHVKPFNAMEVDAATIGNHELDFGIELLRSFVSQTSGPDGTCSWVMSNLRVKGADSKLAGMAQTAVIQKGDLTIGVIGIAEQEWFDTFNDLDEEIEFVDEK